MYRWVRDVLFFAAGVWVTVAVSFLAFNRPRDVAVESSRPPPLSGAIDTTELITLSAPASPPSVPSQLVARKIVISNAALQSAKILTPPPLPIPPTATASTPASGAGMTSPSLDSGSWPSALRVPNSALFSGTLDVGIKKRQQYWNSPLVAILTQDGDQHRNKIGIAVATNFDIELQTTSLAPNHPAAARISTRARKPVTTTSGWFHPNETECTPADDATLHLRQRIGLHRLPPSSDGGIGTGGPGARDVRVVILLPWIGMNPIDLPWFHYFLESCRMNAPLVSWMLFTTSPITRPTNAPTNVHFIDITAGNRYADWSDLFERKLKLNVKVPINPMHIKDLKPTFGLVFEEWTREYTHFGFGDTDVIYGDFRRFLLVPDLLSYDIISFVSHDLPWMRLAGQFAVFKNTPLLRDFWRRNAEHEKQLSQVFEIYFDELHMPESLHIEQCVKWLLVWCQFSDLDHEQSGWQFQWQNGRLFALNPINNLPPPESRNGANPNPTPHSRPVLSSTLITEGAILHFYRCKHRFSTDSAAQPSHPHWVIDVNRGAGINEMKVFTQPNVNSMLDLRDT